MRVRVRCTVQYTVLGRKLCWPVCVQPHLWKLENQNQRRVRGKDVEDDDDGQCNAETFMDRIEDAYRQETAGKQWVVCTARSI